MFEEIREALRNARTLIEVEQVSDKYRADVRAMHSNPETRTKALLIANLKAYRISRIKEGSDG